MKTGQEGHIHLNDVLEVMELIRRLWIAAVFGETER
jgi:hypothetical protein